uniref:Proteinase inhibitor n=1 Tax=Kalanchoe fedtschenkoi TaxID=63787 RepID=A0A7N0TUC1_KALFE
MSSECPGKNIWPELVGKDGHEAAGIIESQNHRVRAIVLLVGTPTTRDFRCDRVWVWVNKKGDVVSPPRAG